MPMTNIASMSVYAGMPNLKPNCFGECVWVYPGMYPRLEYFGKNLLYFSTEGRLQYGYFVCMHLYWIV